MDGFSSASVTYTKSFWAKNRPKYADFQRRRREAIERGDFITADRINKEIKREVSSDVREWKGKIQKV
jgi:hypothetical protein